MLIVNKERKHHFTSKTSLNQAPTKCVYKSKNQMRNEIHICMSEKQAEAEVDIYLLAQEITQIQ